MWTSGVTCVLIAGVFSKCISIQRFTYLSDRFSYLCSSHFAQRQISRMEKYQEMQQLSWFYGKKSPAFFAVCLESKPKRISSPSRSQIGHTCSFYSEKETKHFFQVYSTDRFSFQTKNCAYPRESYSFLLFILQAYLLAGADFIETNTFSGTKVAQSDYGLENEVIPSDLQFTISERALQKCCAFAFLSAQSFDFIAGVNTTFEKRKRSHSCDNCYCFTV